MGEREGMMKEFHPLSDIFPMMSGEEFEALVDDIKRNGLLEPIWLYEGKILDGRNRYKACLEAGIEPKFAEYKGDSPLAFIVSKNIKRRHLTATQLAVVTLKLRPHLEAEARKRQLSRLKQFQSEPPVPAPGPEREDQAEAREKAAALVGVSPRTVQRVWTVAEKAPDLIPKLESGELSAKQAEKEVKRRMREEEKRSRAAQVPDHPDLTIVTGDFRETMLQLAPNSVDLVFTDPPYDEKSISLYRDLAEHAQRVLKPGGSLLAYCGHYALPEIVDLMKDHLRFWWIIAVRHRNAYSSLSGKRVYVTWKPIIWFVKEHHAGKDFVFDAIESETPDKSVHEWAQSVREAKYYIERLSPPGGLVVDPFLGSGTTLLAAISLGRRAWGCEINSHVAARAKENILASMKSE